MIPRMDSGVIGSGLKIKGCCFPLIDVSVCLWAPGGNTKPHSPPFRGRRFEHLQNNGDLCAKRSGCRVTHHTLLQSSGFGPGPMFTALPSSSRSVLMQKLSPLCCWYSDHYLSTVTWATDERIAVQWQNRTQSHVILQVYELSGETWNGTAVTCSTNVSLCASFKPLTTLGAGPQV